MIACFLSNISAKYYKNPSMLSRVIAKNVGDVFFWDTVYICLAIEHWCSVCGTCVPRCRQTIGGRGGLSLLLKRRFQPSTHAMQKTQGFMQATQGRNTPLIWCKPHHVTNLIDTNFDDLKRRNSPYFAFFCTEFDCFAGQSRRSGGR